MKFENSEKLKETAHRLIPGGCHTYAKGDDQFPEVAPGFIRRGEGCRIWDVDGNEFIEYGQGARAVGLGHGYEPVVEAAVSAIRDGMNFNRPSYLEVECAEKLTSIIDSAEQVKFCKDGSTANTAGIKLARAYTGKKYIAVCDNHPFFASNDWFMGRTTVNAGIPEENYQFTMGFQFNDVEGIEKLFQEHADKLAIVILEVARVEDPTPEFLSTLRKLCTQHNTVLLFDEMITGFRWHLKGAQHVYGVQPDLSAFGKAIANGFPLSALAGKREIMDLGGLYHDKERVFLLSTTHGAETGSLAAAIKTMEIYESNDIIEFVYERGEQLRVGVQKVIDELDVGKHFSIIGRACNLFFGTKDADEKPSQPFRTLFIQEMLARNVLAPSFITSYAHKEKDIEQTISAVGESLVIYKDALENGIEKHLRSRPVQPVYRKFN